MTEQLTMEQVLERLKAAGIDINDPKWQERAKGASFEPSQAKQARSLMRHMKKLLEAQLQKDLAEVQRVRENLNRIRYGGGQ